MRKLFNNPVSHYKLTAAIIIFCTGFFHGGYLLAQDNGEDTGMFIPNLISSAHPDYPKRAAARGIEGYVVVSYDVSEKGTVVNPQIINSEPSRIFDRAAVETVMQFLYEPSLEDGKPVYVTGVQSKINFSLRE